MRTAIDHEDLLLNAWRTNNRVTVFLVENLPKEIWEAAMPALRVEGKNQEEIKVGRICQESAHEQRHEITFSGLGMKCGNDACA